MLRLVFLGRLGDVAGAAERAVPHAPTIAALIASLETVLAAAVSDPRVRYAVNGVVCGRDAALPPAAEVAFLPAVSGG